MCSRGASGFHFRMPSVLAVLAEGFEEIETITPIDILRRGGVTVVTAALADGIHVSGRSGIVLHADTTLTAVANTTHDALFLPGGPGVKHLRADPRVRELVLRHHSAGKRLAAICAAPTVLHDAGLLQNRRFTAHASVASELPNLLAGERVVTDGSLLTSRGAGTALDFALALLALLQDPDRAKEVAAAIHA